MSMIGLAPRVRLDAPAPRPPLFGLTASPDAAKVAPAREGWQAGAYLDPYPADLPGSVDPCATGTYRMKDTPVALDQPEVAEGGTIYLGEICSSLGIGDWTEFRARAEVALAARTSWALERQLGWGTLIADSAAYLADADAVLPAGASSVSAASAVAYLEAFLAEQGQLGVLHLTPSVVSFLGFDTFRVDGQQLRTAAGTPVIVGQGYHGTDAENLDPAASGAGEAPAGQDWVFASGEVLYAVSEIYATPETIGEALDRESNEVVYRAERDIWVAFSGGPHAAVLADWSP